jgi:hypothetical protein
MAISTHRQYFERFGLSAAQYGEILVTAAFHGKKLGDTQPCYDVAATVSALKRALQDAGVEPGAVLPGGLDGDARIQVRSKLNQSPSGKASVIHSGRLRRGRPVIRSRVDIDGVAQQLTRLDQVGCTGIQPEASLARAPSREPTAWHSSTCTRKNPHYL